MPVLDLKEAQADKQASADEASSAPAVEGPEHSNRASSARQGRGLLGDAV